MKSSICFLLYFFATSLQDADGYCYGSTKYATTSLLTLSRLYYSNNEYCTFYIQPSAYYSSSSYYLEIKWISFNVEGNLPTCEDYVEVYLTSSYKSIGKYCSDNMVDTKPFNMYSHDGYAKIVFKSDSARTRSGFSLTYQLKSKSGSPMGGYPSSTCYYSDSSAAATFYSSGWPNSYYESSTPCWRRYYAGNNPVRVAVMDVSLYRTSSVYCYTTDSYFEVKASSSMYSSSSYISLYATSVSEKICGTKSPTLYTARKSYVYLLFNRPRRYYSYRGVMVGYMAYRESSSSSSSSAGVAIGAVVGSIIGFLVIAAIVYACYRAGRSKRPSPVAQTSQPQDNAVVVANTATSNVVFQQSQPAVIYQGGAYPAASMQPITYQMPPPQYATGMNPSAQQMPPPQYVTGMDPNFPQMPPPQYASGMSPTAQQMHPPQYAAGIDPNAQQMPPPQHASSMSPTAQQMHPPQYATGIDPNAPQMPPPQHASGMSPAAQQMHPPQYATGIDPNAKQMPQPQL
ncbi:uncharacterized protein LOC135683399 [Rhopilema esculentum]|uniref:uncharacterized protein LOC135683399 n=1 Tax=Rhopilema esculentum TaxID=499914 RepID=UPI0031E29342